MLAISGTVLIKDIVVHKSKLKTTVSHMKLVHTRDKNHATTYEIQDQYKKDLLSSILYPLCHN